MFGGEPGGSCSKCPYNQFGSGENGSKACRTAAGSIAARGGDIPALAFLPTGSLKEFSRYIKRLLSKGKKSNSVVTRFSLKKAVNSGGIAYSQAQFAVDRNLTAEEYALVSKLSEQVKAYSKHIGYEVDSGAEAAADELNVDPETGEVIQPLK